MLQLNAVHNHQSGKPECLHQYVNQKVWTLITLAWMANVNKRPGGLNDFCRINVNISFSIQQKLVIHQQEQAPEGFKTDAKSVFVRIFAILFNPNRPSVGEGGAFRPLLPSGLFCITFFKFFYSWKFNDFSYNSILHIVAKFCKHI